MDAETHSPPPLPAHASKQQRYEALLRDVDAVLSGERDAIVWMATLACVIRERLACFWAGFYRVVRGELVIGPYQGTLGCLRIPFSRGVCGACARSLETIVVPDVYRFPDHIACDSRSRSEIVVPVLDREGRLRAVLDLDSTELGAFDETDRGYLERLVLRLQDVEWIDPL
ncbi:MAG: GAF domain-containing protein [Acidobacteriota bacterium]